MADPQSQPAAAHAAAIHSLPKAELHLHMEGAMEPATVVELAARYGDTIDVATVAARYATPDFMAFIEAYKWVTSYLRAPRDYALAATRLAEQLFAQNVVYAEVTLSAGVMLLRKQDIVANYRAIREAVAPFEPRGLRMQWILDVVRQFGANVAWDVVRPAVELRNEGVVAFGMGGDELGAPATDYRAVYEFAIANGLHSVVHAGEIGGPESVRDAIEVLHAERIGHGIAAARDPQLMELLAARSIPLEICPTSNLRTGALARQLGKSGQTLSLRDHPLPQLLRAGVPLSLSTDDPAMFETNLTREYAGLTEMGLREQEIIHVAEASFAQAFLPATGKASLLAQFRRGAAALRLL